MGEVVTGGEHRLVVEEASHSAKHEAKEELHITDSREIGLNDYLEGMCINSKNLGEYVVAAESPHIMSKYEAYGNAKTHLAPFLFAVMTSCRVHLRSVHVVGSSRPVRRVRKTRHGSARA